jgi:hypothetical protein
MSRHALVLIGSAKPARSNSAALADYLIARLQERGFESRTMGLPKILLPPDGPSELFRLVDAADLIILSSPLYVDSLPYLVTQALERIAAHRQHNAHAKRVPFAAIVNCGFPEALHNAPAIAICRRFAVEVGYEWAGGLALGGGEAIQGKSLLELKGMARNIMQSLDLAADALATGQPIPDEAVVLMAKPVVSPWLYSKIGTLGWRLQARRHGTGQLLDARPYE